MGLQSYGLVGPRQLFLLRAAGFLLPCYIMAWAISILQRRRQRQVLRYVHVCYLFTSFCNIIHTKFFLILVIKEAAALAATQVAFVLQSGQRRGLQFTIASGPHVAPHLEPV